MKMFFSEAKVYSQSGYASSVSQRTYTRCCCECNGNIVFEINQRNNCGMLMKTFADVYCEDISCANVPVVKLIYAQCRSLNSLYRRLQNVSHWSYLNSATKGLLMPNEIADQASAASDARMGGGITAMIIQAR